MGHSHVEHKQRRFACESRTELVLPAALGLVEGFSGQLPEDRLLHHLDVRLLPERGPHHLPELPTDLWVPEEPSRDGRLPHLHTAQYL